MCFRDVRFERTTDDGKTLLQDNNAKYRHDAAGNLILDANKRPIGGAGDIVPSLRREASTKLSSVFGSQGVAAVTVVDRNRIALSIRRKFATAAELSFLMRHAWP